MVVSIGVRADDGRMTGEVFLAEFQAKCLCLFHGQAVVGCISGVKADDILVAFDITMLGVLTILAVCQQTGCCKGEIATLKGVEQVGFPQLRSALFIQKLLSSERIMLVNEVRFDGGVVRVFITIRLFKSLATASNCMSQICGLWLNNAAALATEAICLSVSTNFRPSADWNDNQAVAYNQVMQKIARLVKSPTADLKKQQEKLKQLEELVRSYQSHQFNG